MTLNFNQARGPGTSVGYGPSLVTLAVPEPASMAMLAMGGASLAGYHLRRRNATQV